MDFVFLLKMNGRRLTVGVILLAVLLFSLFLLFLRTYGRRDFHILNGQVKTRPLSNPCLFDRILLVKRLLDGQCIAPYRKLDMFWHLRQ